MILIKSQLDLKQFFISMVTDINMNDSPPRQYITQGHSVNLSLLFPLKRVKIKISQVHPRVWGTLEGDPTF